MAFENGAEEEFSEVERERDRNRRRGLHAKPMLCKAGNGLSLDKEVPRRGSDGCGSERATTTRFQQSMKRRERRSVLPRTAYIASSVRLPARRRRVKIGAGEFGVERCKLEKEIEALCSEVNQRVKRGEKAGDAVIGENDRIRRLERELAKGGGAMCVAGRKKREREIRVRVRIPICFIYLLF